MISIKRFMKLNPSVKTKEHAKRLLKSVKEQQKKPPYPEANKLFEVLTV